MIKLFFLFYIVSMIVRNPILAILLVLLVVYLADRRFLRLFPSIVQPMRRMNRISNLKRQLVMNPHDKPGQYALAQAHMERRQYHQALTLLKNLPDTMKSTADVLYDTGVCQLNLGRLNEGEALVMEALRLDPGLRYGDPYLKLATALAQSRPSEALDFLREFQNRNHSSCESYYRMGSLYTRLGDGAEAKRAWQQALQTYAVLPTFRKRVERRWAFLSFLRMNVGR